MRTSNAAGRSTADEHQRHEELVRSYRRNPQPEVLDRIIEAFEWDVRLIALRTRWPHEPLDDLAQVARMGLLAAIQRYDPERGVTFRTFAEATMVGMVRHHHRGALQVRVPRAVQDLHTACRRAVDRLTGTLQRVPTIAEVAADTGLGEPAVEAALIIDQLFRPVSLSSRSSDDGDRALDELIGIDDADLESAAERSEIHDALATLPHRLRTIVFLHFYDGRTQTEIGATLGISQVQVSRLMAKALAAMRDEVGSDGRVGLFTRGAAVATDATIRRRSPAVAARSDRSAP